MQPLSQPTDWLLVAGSYTEPYGAFRAVGEGVSLLRLTADGDIALIDQLDMPNPSYLRVAPGRLYATLETDDQRAAVAVVELRDNRLVLRQQVMSPGRIPCHLDIHPAGDWIAGTCYGTGEVFVRRLGGDGLVMAESGMTIRREGHSVDPERQTSAHPHAARFSPDGNWLVVPDLGTDEVATYGFDAATGCLGTEPAVLKAPAGSGPRLALFCRDANYLLVVREMASEVASHAWDGGRLTEIAALSTLSPHYAGHNTAAGLRWHPDGETFAVSNRGADTIALFTLDAATGAIAPRGAVSSGGRKPRDFEFTPCGNYLIASNQSGDCLAVYALASGTPVDTGRRFALRSPSCIRVFGPATLN